MSSSIHTMTIRFRSNNEAEELAYQYLLSESKKRGLSLNQMIVYALNYSREKNIEGTFYMSEHEIAELVNKIYEKIGYEKINLTKQSTNVVDETEPEFVPDDLKFCF